MTSLQQITSNTAIPVSTTATAPAQPATGTTTAFPIFLAWVDLTQPTPEARGDIRTGAFEGAYYRSDLRSWAIQQSGGSMKFDLNLPLEPLPEGKTLVLQLVSGIVGGASNCPINVSINGQDVLTRFDPHNDHWYAIGIPLPLGALRPGSNRITLQLDPSATTCVFVGYVEVVSLVPSRIPRA